MAVRLWRLLLLLQLVVFLVQLPYAFSSTPASSNSSVHASTSVAVPPPSSSSSPPSPYILTSRFSPSMAIIVVVLLSALLFMGFFSVYVRRCTTDDHLSSPSSTFTNNHSPLFLASNLPFPVPPLAPPKGLDPSLVDSLPLLRFSALSRRHDGMECVVCLKDFEDDEALRLLPKCGHCFHQDCIDMWLFSHTTCPLCRRSLVDDQSGGSADEVNWSSSTDRGEVLVSLPSASPAEVAIDIRETSAGIGSAASEFSPQLEPRVDVGCSQSRSPILGVMETPTGSKRPIRSSRLQELRRSHSTGHSLVINGARNRTNLLITSPCSETTTDPPCSPLLRAITGTFHRSKSYALLSDLRGEQQLVDDQHELDTNREEGEWSSWEPTSSNSKGTTRSSSSSSSIRRALKRLAGMDARASFLSEHKSEAITTQSVHVHARDHLSSH